MQQHNISTRGQHQSPHSLKMHPKLNICMCMFGMWVCMLVCVCCTVWMDQSPVCMCVSVWYVCYVRTAVSSNGGKPSSWRGVSCNGKWSERKGGSSSSEIFRGMWETLQLYCVEKPNTLLHNMGESESESVCVCVCVCVHSMSLNIALVHFMMLQHQWKSI